MVKKQQQLNQINWKKQLLSNQVLSFRDNHDSHYYYNKKEWGKLRNKYYKEHPLCEECLKEGKYVPADDIHHIKHFMSGKTEQQRLALLLDENNLKALCKFHHKCEHFGEPQHLNDF